MSFRQVDQRHVSTEICLMEWSPTMDLIALVTVQGEVLLHRLSWQKVWSLPPRGRKDKEIKVTAIAWKPDGKILAIAYDAISSVFLTDIENSETIHLLEVTGAITSLKWVDYAIPNVPKHVFYCDYNHLYLPKYYSLVKNYLPSNKIGDENLDDPKRAKDQDGINLLMVGTDMGHVHLYAFGMFNCGYVANVLFPGKGKVLSVSLSENFGLMTVFLKCKEENEFIYKYKSIDLPLLKNKVEEFRVVALKYGQIVSLLTFLSATIRSITEAWEDILLEIDSKLMKYASDKKKVSDGTISDDFLELLMFGTPSDALEKFLLHDLTENGLKKFSHSIELSYSNIQKLVLKKLQNVASSLFYNLSDLKGIVLWKERFGELGLSPEAVKASLASVGSFLMKATEIQQVIDNSMKNFKAFFRWLYTVILRLSDEPIPNEITKITQQDLTFVAEFLKENFTEEYDPNKKTTFKLERVGQYLKNEKLIFPPCNKGNACIEFLESHPILRDSDLIFPYHPELSLIQQHHDIRKTVDAAFSGPKNTFHKSTNIRNVLTLFRSKDNIDMKIAHSCCTKSGYSLIAFTIEVLPADALYILTESVNDPTNLKCIGLTFGELPNSVLESPAAKPYTGKGPFYKISDIKFYNDDILSVLLSESNSSTTKMDCPVLLQLPLKALCAEALISNRILNNFCSNIPIISGEKYIPKGTHKKLENSRVIELAVSGSRKVACILFASRRQVRLFEMEVEEDDSVLATGDVSMKEFEPDDPFECSTSFSNSLNSNKNSDY